MTFFNYDYALRADRYGRTKNHVDISIVTSNETTFWYIPARFTLYLRIFQNDSVNPGIRNKEGI